jgi:hypothetical protein
MFTIKPTPESKALDEAISSVLEDMKKVDSTTEEYNAMSDQLVKLMKLKKDAVPTWRPSPDALMTVAGNLLGILLILNYERAHVITSKAIGFVSKLR